MRHSLLGWSQYAPQQSLLFTEIPHCCTHPCSKHVTSPPHLSILSIPDSLSPVSLLKNLGFPRERTQALNTLGDPGYSEAKVLHPRTKLQRSLSNVPWSKTLWGNLKGLLMNFLHIQFLHISFCSKRRIHESIYIGLGILSFPFTNTIIFTIGWWQITSRYGQGVL